MKPRASILRLALSFALALALWTSFAGCALADTPALGFTGGTFGAFTDSGTDGWSFRFDLGGDGLGAAHPVGIFSSTGTLLASTTVLAGTASPLVEGFRYAPISTLTLPAGVYTIGAFSAAPYADLFAYNVSTITTSAGISYLGSRAIASDSLAFEPTDSKPLANSYFGPNFQTGSVAVPDTRSTLVLLGLHAFLEPSSSSPCHGGRTSAPEQDGIRQGMWASLRIESHSQRFFFNPAIAFFKQYACGAIWGPRQRSWLPVLVVDPARETPRVA
ncbi:MAG: hypothetical protein INR62_03805 [Rhodospirillales bacterium]|nr:hypothetical protein [Acetobacter sp.]